MNVNLVSANNLSLGVFKSPTVPRRDEKVFIKGEKCTVTGVAYDFDSEEVYAIVFLDVMAVSKSDEQTEGSQDSTTEDPAEGK